VDEVTFAAVFVVAALGVFSWRRWRESLRVIGRHEATLRRLRSTEGQVALKDHLINAVSHELRTPLTAILGYAGLAGNEKVDAGEREAMMERIVAQGWDLAQIIEDLLTRAQSETESLSVARVSVSYSAQAAQVIETMGPEDRERVHLTSGRVRAQGDPARVRQIIRNLVSNAVRYGGPRITIETQQRSGMALLDVTDDGPGVPLGERELIFHPYHRLAGGARNPGSIGLGLSISRELARRMSGDLTYQRRRGQSVFRLALPLAEDLHTEVDSPETQAMTHSM
jgi:signal transduction histidine kinase